MPEWNYLDWLKLAGLAGGAAGGMGAFGGAPGAVPGAIDPRGLAIPGGVDPNSFAAAAAGTNLGLPGGNPVQPLDTVPTVAPDERSWWTRQGDNISNAWDKAWTEDPKTGLSPAQKGLASAATAMGVGGGAGGGGGSSTPPVGSLHRPAALNAGQLGLSREQQLELLRKRSMMAAPWLQRAQQPGLMG